MFGLDPIVLMVGLLVTVTAVVIVLLFTGDDRSSERVKAVYSRQEVVAKQRSEAAKAERRKNLNKAADEINEHTRSQQDEREAKSIEAKLSQAGLDWSKSRFFTLCGICGAVALVGSFVAGLAPLVCLGIAFIAAVGLPLWGLGFMKKRRLKAFYDELPNALDVLVRGIKSGLPLNDSMRIVAKEAKEPLRSEFLTIVEEQQMGISMAEAAARLNKRMPLPEANFFGIVLNIQSKAGGNLSEALGNLSRVIRERKKMKGKIVAMSQEAKSSAMIIGALPIIVMVLVQLASPDYLTPLFETTAGRFVLIASGLWMLMGVLIMKKMISFDI